MARPATYVITLQGVISQDWATWFGGIAIATAQDAAGQAVTRLTCTVNDQPALHAILNKIRDLNLTLVSITQSDCLTQKRGGYHG